MTSHPWQLWDGMGNCKTCVSKKGLIEKACCEGKYSLKKEHILSEVKKNEKNSKVQKIQEYLEDFGEGYCSNYQECLWNLFENPNSSFPAKVGNLGNKYRDIQ